MKYLDNVINGLVRFIMAFSTLVLSIATILQVISRYIFKNPIGWGQDIVRLSFIYLVFWGGAYCVKGNEHLNIDVLLASLKPKAKQILEVTINIALFFFFIFIVYYGYIFMQSGSNQKSPYLSIPMSIYYLSLPTAGVIMIYYQVRQIFKQMVEIIGDSNGGDIQ